MRVSRMVVERTLGEKSDILSPDNLHVGVLAGALVAEVRLFQRRIAAEKLVLLSAQCRTRLDQVDRLNG